MFASYNRTILLNVKVGDIKHSDQCAKDLCIYERRMSVAVA